MLEEHHTAWEYCELGLWGFPDDEGVLLSGPGWHSCDCSIRYYTVDGVVRRQLAEGRPLSIDPFPKAMALLGAAGWELVSVQHDSVEVQYLFGRKIAYFKRPVVAGRAINEPELVI